MVDSQFIPWAGQEFPPMAGPQPEFAPHILKILSKKNLRIERIVKSPDTYDVFHRSCMCSTFCYLCFPCAVPWCMTIVCNSVPLQTRVPKFLVEDDSLEVTTYPHTMNHQMSFYKNDLMSVKFYRTVEKPYIQTITLTWNVDYKDDRGNITGTRTFTFDLQVQATIIKNSFHNLLLKVDAFDPADNAYKLLYQSEYKVARSNSCKI